MLLLNIHCYTSFAVSPVGSVRASPSVLNTTIGDSAMFTCTSLGGPANHLYWKKTSSDLIVSNSSVLSLLSLTAFDDGQYQCIASNMAGADTVTVTLYGTLSSSVHVCMYTIASFPGPLLNFYVNLIDAL